MANFLFYLAALSAVLTAVGVIVAKNPVLSVTSLLGCFFSVSLIYLLAGFQFLAAVQILVYAGAVMVLFLFVVMLLNLGETSVAVAHEGPVEGNRARAGMAVAFGMLAVSLSPGVRCAFVPPLPLDRPDWRTDPGSQRAGTRSGQATRRPAAALLPR